MEGSRAATWTIEKKTSRSMVVHPCGKSPPLLGNLSGSDGVVNG